MDNSSIGGKFKFIDVFVTIALKLWLLWNLLK